MENFRRSQGSEDGQPRKRFERDLPTDAAHIDPDSLQAKLLGGNLTKRQKLGPERPPVAAPPAAAPPAAATDQSAAPPAAADPSAAAAPPTELTKAEKAQALKDFGDEKDAQRRRQDAQRRRQVPRPFVKECSLCIGSEQCDNLRKGLYIFSTDRTWLASLPESEMLVPFHSMITPVEHLGPTEFLDRDTLEEIRNIKKALVYFFKSLQSVWFDTWGYPNPKRDRKPYVPVFVEWNTVNVGEDRVNLKRNLHASIDVLPLREDDFEEAMIILKRELLDTQDINQSNVQFKEFEPSPRLGVSHILPRKGTPYLFIDFGLEKSYVFFIEDTRKFSRKHIRGMLQSLLPESVGRFEGYVQEEAPASFSMDLYLAEFVKKFEPYQF